MQLVSLYGLIVIVLWHAPIYCWFLLVSGWARRATFLWAVLPPVAIGVFEYIAFHTSHIGSLLQDRVFGFAAAAFDLTDKNGVPVDGHFIPLTQLAPGRFLSNPSLVDRADHRRSVPWRSGPVAPLSGTHLIRMHPGKRNWWWTLVFAGSTGPPRIVQAIRVG